MLLLESLACGHSDATTHRGVDMADTSERPDEPDPASAVNPKDVPSVEAATPPREFARSFGGSWRQSQSCSRGAASRY